MLLVAKYMFLVHVTVQSLISDIRIPNNIINILLEFKGEYNYISFQRSKMNLNYMRQSEVSQKEKDKYGILTHIYSI